MIKTTTNGTRKLNRGEIFVEFYRFHTEGKATAWLCRATGPKSIVTTLIGHAATEAAIEKLREQAIDIAKVLSTPVNYCGKVASEVER